MINEANSHLNDHKISCSCHVIHNLLTRVSTPECQQWTQAAGRRLAAATGAACGKILEEAEESDISSRRANFHFLQSVTFGSPSKKKKKGVTMTRAVHWSGTGASFDTYTVTQKGKREKRKQAFHF